MTLFQLLGQPHRLVFRRLHPRVLGQCEFDERRISIDMSKRTNPARTYVHELIHLWDSNLSESQVLRREKNLWKRLNSREKILVYSCLFGGRKLRDRIRQQEGD